MLEIAKPLKVTLEKSTLANMKSWLSNAPNNAAWYVISDYCFGDKNKKNDTACFSILLNHDKIENIKEYINNFAPKDIKSSRSISEGFLKYINSPVIFNITFLIDRDTNYLKDYATFDNMKEFLSVFRDFITEVDNNSTYNDGFVESVLKRSISFERDFEKNNFNAKLSRQIYLVATFASLIFHYLVKTKDPSNIAWISDRDAITHRYDGFIYDLAYFMYISEVCGNVKNTDNSGITMIHKPQFIFPIPESQGKNEYDELIRIPDYLAGTLADYDMTSGKFSKEKFYTIFYDYLVGSKNHSVVQVLGNSNKITSRRLIHEYT